MSQKTDVESEAAQRAECRRKEIMEALGGSVIVKSFQSSPKYKVTLSSPAKRSVEINDSRRKSLQGNESPQIELSHLLYPAQPPRSVYNSPLIKANRQPLWKSPPPYSTSPHISDQYYCNLRGNTPVKGGETGRIVPRESYKNTASQRLAGGMLNNTSLTSLKDNRLYPSLPRNDLAKNNVTSSDKTSKDQSNYNTALTKNDIGPSISLRKMEHGVNSNKNAELQGFPCTKDSGSDMYQTMIKSYESASDQGGKSNSSSANSENDIEDTYDMDRFLEEALGSVLDLNSPTGEMEVTARSTDHLPEDSFHSVTSFRSLDKIHTTSTLRSSMRLVKPSPLITSQHDKVGSLLKEAEKQQQLMAQVSKALNISRSSTASSNSLPLVHAERLLLLASLRHQAVLHEVRGFQPLPEEGSAEFKGLLRIFEVSAPLKDNILQSGQNEHLINLWFLCVLRYGQQVFASDVVAYEAGANFITFSGAMELSNLPSSFVASLEIYTLRTRLPKESVRNSKLSRACKILRRKSKSCLGPASSSGDLLHLRTPAFALSGNVCIDLAHIKKSQPKDYILEKVPLMSPLRGSLRVVMETSLISFVQLSGFLTVLEKAGDSYAWQRRWCHLHELHLRFWNYPSDQDEKEPLEKIDLRYCSSEKIEVAPRHLCPRPRTLMLEAKRPCAPSDMNSTLMECNGELTAVRYFLACDSIKEMNEWVSILNQVLSSIQAWEIQ